MILNKLKKLITKYIVLILILSVQMPETLKSQNFLEIGNEWIFEKNDSHHQSIQSMKIVKDTLINGIEYKKIISTEDNCGEFRKIEYLREENNKVYRLKHDFGGELLIIDFEEEDSYEFTYESDWANQPIEVETLIDSTGIITLPDGNELNVKYVRILNNQSFGDDAVYILSDRVGYIPTGLLFPNIGTGLCDLKYWLDLRCHINQNDTLHFQEIIDCYEIEVINAIESVFKKQINIFPNPTENEINIENGFRMVYAYDVLGMKKDIIQVGQKINIQEFSNGIYVIVIEEELTGNIYFRKIVKK